MTSRLALIALSVLLLATAAPAQDAIKVATCNPARVFADMQETTDLKQKLENERKNIEAEFNARQEKVKGLQAQRELLKVDSPQYVEADRAFMKEAIEFDTWGKITKAQLEGQQKQQMKSLFDKIVSTTTTVAQQKGLDLVLADQRPDLPKNLAEISVDQLRATLNGRNVMFVGPKADITNDVIAEMDKNYKASGPATAAPTPAPAPAPAAPKK